MTLSFKEDIDWDLQRAMGVATVLSACCLVVATFVWGTTWADWAQQRISLPEVEPQALDFRGGTVMPPKARMQMLVFAFPLIAAFFLFLSGLRWMDPGVKS